jgi:hypothetical protein
MVNETCLIPEDEYAIRNKKGINTTPIILLTIKTIKL